MRQCSQEEYERRVRFTNRASELGIDLYAYDGDTGTPEHQLDELKALMLLQKEEEIPEDLEKRLKEYNKG